MKHFPSFHFCPFRNRLLHFHDNPRYRGENLPDREFLINTAVDSFNVPKERAEEFIDVFVETLKDAELLEDLGGGKTRVLDATVPIEVRSGVGDDQIRKLSKGINVQATDSCFVMMPFAEPLGGYYASVYQPAIEKAKLKAVRADAEIFGTGKIIDQIWNGIHSARVLVAELTGRNPNVLYELGLAHALRKPVVLVSSNEEANILSALGNPEEAILFPEEKVN